MLYKTLTEPFLFNKEVIHYKFTRLDEIDKKIQKKLEYLIYPTTHLLN